MNNTNLQDLINRLTELEESNEELQKQVDEILKRLDMLLTVDVAGV